MSSSTKADSSGLLQSLAGATSTASVSSSTGTTKVLSTTNWFTAEIQQMMFGFGDCRRPLHESAALVEEIAHQQMGSLLCQASDVASMRGSRFVGLEEILFLLRKDKVKLRRLLRYLELKDLKTAALKGSGLDEEEASDVGDAKPQIIKKRRKICYDFLTSIDQTGELLALFDDPAVDQVKHERLVRAELMSRNMDTQQYKEFCEARQASFSRRYKNQRFKDWLMAGVNVDIKPNPQALEIISYLAYETVAQIVDLSLVVKQDHRAVQSQPQSRVMAPVRHNYHDLQTSSLFSSQAKATLAGMGSPARAESFQSPPATPTTGPGTTQGTPALSTAASSTTTSTTSSNSNNSTAQAGVGSLTSQASSGNLSRINKKKRKRSGPPTTLDTSWDSAIMPADIREAMRRYSEDIGPFASFTKLWDPYTPRTQLLCM